MPLIKPCAKNPCDELKDCSLFDIGDMIDKNCPPDAYLVCVGDGTFTFKERPYFVARIKTAASQTLPIDETIILSVPIIDEDTPGGMGTTNNFIRCIQDGYYHVKGAITGVPVEQGSIQIIVTKNGSLITRTTYTTLPGHFFTFQATNEYARLSIDDEIAIKAVNQTGGEVEIAGGALIVRLIHEL